MSDAQLPLQGPRKPSEREMLFRHIDEQTNGCWYWTGSLNGHGYGSVGRWNKGQRRAHRAVYEELVGPIPSGFDLDHECHNADLSCKGGRSCMHRRCVNPEHLVPRTRKENLNAAWGRFTHCKKGHPYDGLMDGGKRRCRECKNILKRRPIHRAICVFCASSFVGRRIDSLYCSPLCKARAQNIRRRAS